MRADLAAAHRFAERRFGLLSIADLRQFDISPHRVVRLVKSGLLVPVHRGVYRLPGSQPPELRALAACLACGRDAVVSHVTGLELWGIRERDSHRLPDVTLPYARRSAKPGISVHRSIHLGPLDVTRLGVIRSPGSDALFRTQRRSSARSGSNAHWTKRFVCASPTRTTSCESSRAERALSRSSHSTGSPTASRRASSNAVGSR